MTYDELNQYIYHYLTEDKTKSAIMLTAPWGTGKSFYINKKLIPYLNENGSKKCIVVPLYGLNSIYEVSKTIFFESRLKFLNGNSTKHIIPKFVGATIFKGISSFWGIDLSKSESEMKELFESLDLTDTLIVFEDLERTNINIIELLGYINNLVEHDNTKVLIVTNEKEFLQKNSGKKGKTQEDAKDLSSEYLKIKEKTVSDTIHYICDLKESIKDIIQTFENEQLSHFSSDSCVEDIADLFIMNGISNLRTFIFACQKTVDIFDKMKLDITENEDFLKTIFFSIILFSNRIKNGANTSWKRNELFSVELASEMFPLFKFCYDYIMFQNLDLCSLEKCKDALYKYRLYDAHKSRSDDDLNKLYYWYLNSEKDVISAYESV